MASARPLHTKFLFCLAPLVLSSFPTVVVAASLPQSGGGVPASGPRFHVVRSVSGSKGSEQGGRYVIEDPRDVFYLPQDKQVIIYFEWDGPIGQHHLEGYWKSPDSKSVVISDFNYESKNKFFAAYWSLNLSEGMPTGMWTLEAHVDGEITGSHSFQIIAAPKPAGTDQSGPTLLTPAQVYQKALASTVTLETFTASADKLSQGSGFFIGDGLVLTAFRVIDGASSLRAVLPGGQPTTVNGVVLWNRWQDWAILQVTSNAPALKRAKANSWVVGDRCFFLNAAEDGTRTIVDLNIVGTKTYPDAGDRLNLSAIPSVAASGSPLLNEYGEVIGVVGVGRIPGGSLASNTGYGFGRFVVTGNQAAGLALPISSIPETLEKHTTTSLSELEQKGEFLTPVAGADVVAQGSLSLDLDRRRGVTPMPIHPQTEFTHKDQQFFVFMMWNPKDKRTAVTLVRVYDLNNKLLFQTKPDKVNLRPALFLATDWQIPLAPIPAGTYRLDVILADQPVWRTFFTVTD